MNKTEHQLKTGIKIYQRKEDCHYETVVRVREPHGVGDFYCGFGWTQEEADTKALSKFAEECRETSN